VARDGPASQALTPGPGQKGQWSGKERLKTLFAVLPQAGGFGFASCLRMSQQTGRSSLPKKDCLTIMRRAKPHREPDRRIKGMHKLLFCESRPMSAHASFL